MNFSWSTATREQKLEWVAPRLAESKSPAQISTELERVCFDPPSRNAIIGFARRNELKILTGTKAERARAAHAGQSRCKGRPAPVGRKVKTPEASEPAELRKKTEQPELAEPDTIPEPVVYENVRFLDREPWQCAWPVGDNAPGPEMMCCGAPKDLNTKMSYCVAHAKLARGRLLKRSEKQAMRAAGGVRHRGQRQRFLI